MQWPPTSGEDDLWVVAELFGFGGEVVGVDADAVAADEAGREAQEVPFGAGGGDDAFVEGGDAFEGGVVVAGNDFDDAFEGVLAVAGVDAFGGVAEVEVAAGGEAGGAFEGGAADLLGEAGPDGALEDHEVALAQVWADGGAGAE